MKSVFQKYDLQFDNLVAYGADNAALNYGKHQSVFMNLKNHNQNLIKGNCNCHVLHNCAKYGLMRIPLGIENLIYKLFNHFATSAKRNGQLKSCYVFCDIEYSKILKHGSIRWLTLYAAIDRMLKNFKVIKTYFTGVDSSECHQVLVDFFGLKVNSNQIL